MESLGVVIRKKDYIDKIKSIEANSKARTRIAELAAKYLKFIQWDNKNLENDTAIYFMLCHRVAKKESYEKLEKLLVWIEKKDCLFPPQVFKLLAKQLESK